MRNKGLTVSEVLIILAIIGILASTFLLPYFQCEKQTKDLGFAGRWSIVGGCQIEIKPGKWLPLERYRVIDD